MFTNFFPREKFMAEKSLENMPNGKYFPFFMMKSETTGGFEMFLRFLIIFIEILLRFDEK